MKNAYCYDLDLPLSVTQTAPASVWRRLRLVPVKMIDTILLWQERADQRAHLAGLDERALRDIGLSRADVARETSLPFWRGC
jgi:uncharacterized protein YjiS (DUF1127 family)